MQLQYALCTIKNVIFSEFSVTAISFWPMRAALLSVTQPFTPGWVRGRVTLRCHGASIFGADTLCDSGFIKIAMKIFLIIFLLQASLFSTQAGLKAAQLYPTTVINIALPLHCRANVLLPFGREKRATVRYVASCAVCSVCVCVCACVRACVCCIPLQLACYRAVLFCAFCGVMRRVLLSAGSYVLCWLDCIRRYDLRASRPAMVCTSSRTWITRVAGIRSINFALARVGYQANL